MEKKRSASSLRTNTTTLYTLQGRFVVSALNSLQRFEGVNGISRELAICFELILCILLAFAWSPNCSGSKLEPRNPSQLVFEGPVRRISPCTPPGDKPQVFSRPPPPNGPVDSVCPENHIKLEYLGQIGSEVPSPSSRSRRFRRRASESITDYVVRTTVTARHRALCCDPCCNYVR